MPVTLEQKIDSHVIHLESVVDMSCAAELKAALTLAIQSGREVRISLGGATTLDLTALQLLWAAEREAKASGTAFSLAEEMPEALSRALVNVGFERLLSEVDATRFNEVRKCPM